jgi:pimeloyl-ACP methyl ester carboxylesterase
MSIGRSPALPEGRWADIDGPVHYVEWSGPAAHTFVLVHGLGGSHLNWIRVAPRLAERGRVIVVDLPGFGRSPLAGRRSAMATGRRLLARFIREVATGRAIVVGNSMGGGYAMLVAAFEPEIVSGLVLTSSVFPWAPGGWPSPIVVGGFALYRAPLVGELVVRERYRRVDPESVVRLAFRINAADPSRIPEDVVQAHVALERERRLDPDGATAFVEAARSILALGARPSLTARVLDAVRSPVLVIHGTEDRLVPLAFARAAVDRHPSWRFRFLPGAGHVPQLEAPERWLGAVEEFLPTVDAR